MIISRLGESCSCGSLFPPREIPWTIEGTAHHYYNCLDLLLCCTWDTQDDKELTLVSSTFEGHYEGHYIVLYRWLRKEHMSAAPNLDKESRCRTDSNNLVSPMNFSVR